MPLLWKSGSYPFPYWHLAKFFVQIIFICLQIFRKEPFFYGHDNHDQLVKIAKVLIHVSLDAYFRLCWFLSIFCNSAAVISRDFHNIISAWNNYLDVLWNAIWFLDSIFRAYTFIDWNRISFWHVFSHFPGAWNRWTECILEQVSLGAWSPTWCPSWKVQWLHVIF